MGTHEIAVPGTTQVVSRPSDQDICDAYLYLLGRLLVLRREHLDFEQVGFRWNAIVHREVGSVGRANPNLDVAYSEAWLAVDETSCTMLDLPEIRGRYYTVQVLNPWGETLVNLNRHTFPDHPAGAFAFCLAGARIPLRPGTQRVDLPGRKARMLVRIELGANPADAIKLQRRILLHPTAAPRIATPVAVPLFTNDRLPGADVFDSSLAILTGEPDINPGSAALHAKVRAVAAGVLDDHLRKRVDRVIHERAWRQLDQAIAAMGVGRGGWVHPRVAGSYGTDWLGRTIANLLGIWSNTKEEVVYFGAGTAKPLEGSHTYRMRFERSDLPGAHVKYLWSVTCVDAREHRVVANPRNRYSLSQHSPLQLAPDGSLTLYFAPRLPPGAPESNWLPTPEGKRFVLTWRSYGPDRSTVQGTWFPPELERM